MSRVAAAARGLVGRRFRLHGRGEALDCVGVAATALAAAGWRGVVPSGYALRGGDPGTITALLDAMLERQADMAAGDVLLMAAGPGQLHLGVVVGGESGTGFVHADAGLGRVVERPGAPPWPVLGIWRWRGD
jgi:hypothetical protein